MVDLLERGERIQIHSVKDMDSFVASGEEYLPVNTVLDDLRQEKPVVEAGVEVTNFQKQGTVVELHCKNSTDSLKRIEVPLLYYKGYQAVGIQENGSSFLMEVSAGTNNVVSIQVEAYADCDVRLEFHEPWYWRIAEIISLVVTGIVLWYICKKYLRRK